jgi:hypothetical protein
MMVCDTFPWQVGASYDAWLDDANHKGWLSACGNSAPCVSSTLASVQPQFCVVDNSIAPVPGNKTQQSADGYDTRFGSGSTTAYPSDLNISSYPHDNTAGSTPTWDCAGYWSTNHSGVSAPTGCTSTASITRYSVYQWERANNAIPPAGTPSKNTPTTTAERRLAYIAIYNCSGGTVPEGFLKTFMIEPAQGKSVKTGFVEVLGMATTKTDPTVIHEEVQLYR